MKLYLVQHGEACAKDVDPERPLTERGGQDVARLAVFLQQSGPQVTRVIHSGKLRARQTAERLANAVATDIELEVSGLINPNDNPNAFDWQSDSWNGETLVVGHLPFLSRLVSHLLIGDAEKLIAAFEPGTMVCMEYDRDGRWQINWMVRSELLRK